MIRDAIVQCPGCSTRLQVSGQPTTKVQANCPTCGQAVVATIPGAASPASTHGPDPLRAADSQPSNFDALPDIPPATKPAVNFSNSLPRKKYKASSSHQDDSALERYFAPLLLAALGLFFLTLIAVGTGWYLMVASSSSKDSEAASIDRSTPAIVERPAQSNSSRDSGDLASSFQQKPSASRKKNYVTSIPTMKPEEIMGEWFDILQASESGERATVLTEGTPEYEARVERYLEGERRSRELLRIALASPKANANLKEAMAHLSRENFDKYQFGVTSREVASSEFEIRKDPRLVARAFKPALSRYMNGPFFPLSPPSSFKGSRFYLNYVETMGEFAMVMNHFEATGQWQVDVPKLQALNDQLIENAIEQPSTIGPMWLPSDHSKADQAYQKIIDALFAEMLRGSSKRVEIAKLASQHNFARRQNHKPVSRKAVAIRQAWEDMKYPEKARKRELAEKAEQLRIALEDKQLREEIERKLREKRQMLADQRAKNANKGRSSRMPFDPRTRSPGGRPGNRLGSSRLGSGDETLDGRPMPPGFGPRFGPGGPRAIPSTPYPVDDETTIVVRINCGSDPKPLIDEWLEKLEIKFYRYSRSGDRASLRLNTDLSIEEFMEACPFEKRTTVDAEKREIVIEFD